MNKTTITLLLCIISINLQAQWQWHNPLDAPFPVIQNQGWTNEIGNTYVRLPLRAKDNVNKHVWELSRHAAGLAIHFYSNAPEIKIRYKVEGSYGMHHMPATGVSGIDLYAINSDGYWNICSGDFEFNDTIQYHYQRIKKDKYHNEGYEYRLYLPLYNSIKWIELGIPKESKLKFIPLSPEKPIVLYGTSIAQGACASRPAMAWGSIVERSLGYPLVNLGFSGNAKMEKEVIGLINELDARLYILDCMANLFEYESSDVTNRIVEAVKTIRQNHKSPILLIEHAGNSNMNTDSMRNNTVADVNIASRKAFEMLLNKNIKDVFYLTREELNIPTDGWVDYVHLNDLGMQRQADAVEKKIREILNIPVGDTNTTRPLTQRREPNNYEWLSRHRTILELNKQNPTESLIIGNSITHFWGGKPEGPHKNGVESWKKYMEEKEFRNLGFGWDRIENVLWRVYHDELSGYEAKRIVLMIGTNNLGFSTDQEIVDGLEFLLSAIKNRQPNAKIKVIGILPRRSEEEWVKNINIRISKMVNSKGFLFQDAGKVLLKQDGKLNETLFSDGLHPNEKGYHLIAPLISE